MVVDSIGIVLMIIAALAWRTAREQSSVTSMPVVTQDYPISTMPPLSPGLRLCLMFVPGIIGAVASVGSLMLMQQRQSQDVAFALLGVSLIFVIVSMIAFLMTIHALWQTIQAPPTGVGIQGVARTTPGKAVGFMFIPFYSLYWVFQVWVGLAADMNKTLDMRGVNASRLSTGLAIAISVCTLLSMIPYFGLLAWLANLIMVPMFLWRAFAAANALRTGGGGTNIASS